MHVLMCCSVVLVWVILTTDLVSGKCSISSLGVRRCRLCSCWEDRNEGARVHCQPGAQMLTDTHLVDGAPAVLAGQSRVVSQALFVKSEGAKNDNIAACQRV